MPDMSALMNDPEYIHSVASQLSLLTWHSQDAPDGRVVRLGDGRRCRRCRWSRWTGRQQQLGHVLLKRAGSRGGTQERRIEVQSVL